MSKKKQRPPSPSSSPSKPETRSTKKTRQAEARAVEARAAETVALEIAAPQKESASDTFWQFAAALLLLGAALRLLLLGQGVYSHDEAIHANFALDFLNYRYDPVYHGPVLYHLEALVFWLLGDSDFSARLVPALLGIGVLAVALGTRRYLGEKAALWSLGLLVISPVVVAYSRRLLHDSLVMLLTLGAVLFFARALNASSIHMSTHKEGRRAWIGLAACFALLIATKANAFFIIAMLGSFWGLTKLRNFGGASWTKPLPFWIPLAALFAVIYVSTRVDRTIKTEERFFTLLCLAACFALWEWLRRAPQTSEYLSSKNSAEASLEKSDDGLKTRRRFAVRAFTASGWTFVGVLAFFFGHGVFWWRIPGEILRDPVQWTANVAKSLSAVGHAIVGQGNWMARTDGKMWSDFYLPDTPDWSDICMAIPKMLEYWGGQQGQPRLPGRHDYYAVLLSLYELPLVVAALAGMWMVCRRRTPFTDLLLWWSLTSFVLYSLANEKVPWLMTHIVLPWAFLGGIALAQWTQRALLSTQMSTQNDDAKGWNNRQSYQNKNARYIFGAVCTLGAIYLLRGTLATSFERPGDRREPLFYAQPTEAFRDSLLGAVQRTRGDNRSIWVHPEKYWPAVWYLRKTAPHLGASEVQWGQWPDNRPLRLAVHLTPDDWKTQTEKDPIGQMQLRGLESKFQNWNKETTDFIIWPRASWGALRPNRWVTFWLARHCSEENGMLSEWSHSPAEIASPREYSQ